METLILAAGFAVRLGELTKKTPKALLEVNGQAIVMDVINQILALAIETGNVALITNDRYFNVFQQWLTQLNLEKRIQLVNNGANEPNQRLGAVGDLLYATNQLGWQDKPLLVVASDTLTSLRLKDMMAMSEEHPDAVIIGAFNVQDNITRISGRLGCVLLGNGSNQVTNFIEKPSDPPSHYAGVPYYIFPPECYLLFTQYKQLFGNDMEALDSPGTFISWLIGKIPVYAVVDSGIYLDVGTKADFEELQKNGIPTLIQSAL